MRFVTKVCARVCADMAGDGLFGNPCPPQRDGCGVARWRKTAVSDVFRTASGFYILAQFEQLGFTMAIAASPLCAYSERTLVRLKMKLFDSNGIAMRTPYFLNHFLRLCWFISDVDKFVACCFKNR